MHRLLTALVFVVALPLHAQAQAPNDPLALTRELLKKDKELATWQERYVSALRSELIKLAKDVENIEDPNAFGIAKDRAEGKKLPEGEFDRRKEQALKTIAAYANGLDRTMLAILAGSKAFEYECVRKRLLRSPTVAFALSENDDPKRTALVTTVKSEEDKEKGTTRILAQKITFSPRTLRPSVFEKTTTHELHHILVQARHNAANKELVKLPTNPAVRVSLAALKEPLWKYKPGQYIEKELLAEGIAEMLTQRGFFSLGFETPYVSYLEPAVTSCLLCGIDEKAVMEWFTGTITTREFFDQFRGSLCAMLLRNGKFTKEEADRVSFAIVNLLLDSKSQQEVSQIEGQHAHFFQTMHSLIRALLDAGYKTEEVMKLGGVPPSIESRLRGSKPPMPPAEKSEKKEPDPTP